MAGQNTLSENTQTQNMRAQSTQWPKILKIHSHTNWLINSVLICKFSEAANYLSLLMFEKVGSAGKNTTSQSFHRNWSWTEKQPRKSKRWVHTGIPHKLFGTVNQIFDWIYMAFVLVKQNCDPPYIKMIFKIFGTLDSFNFQNVEFLQSWSWMSSQ